MDIKTIERDGYKISFINEEEFELIYKDIFILHEYNYETSTKKPIILDCGSHIGLSILFFKKLYPHSKIIAFEPNPLTFKLLEKNIHQNKIEDVILVNAAVASEKGKLNFIVSRDEQAPWTWGDSVVINKWATKETTKSIEVSSVKLSDYIDCEIDLLKLDVEGLEELVLNEVGGKIARIKEICMEYHGSSTNLKNDSGRILEILRSNGFKYNITQKGKIIAETDIIKEDPYWLIVHAYRK